MSTAATALYDLSPALRLMGTGLVLALGPLAWVWLRNRNAPITRRLQVLTLLTLFLTFDLVIFGAFTRLTDSGLGCPDWPGCYGHASPIGADAHIDAAQAALPSGPVTQSKAWIEMIHRYLATGVGVLILTLVLASWAARRATRGAKSLLGGRLPTRAGTRGPPIPLGWPVVTLLWVCLQGAFGALTVTMKLFPAIVTLHLLGGMVLLTLLRAQSVWHAQAFEKLQGMTKVKVLTPALRGWLLGAFALLWLQIALGGWVSTNYAVLACTEFPGCQGAMWPPMNFSEGFTLWRDLGAGADGAYISFQALTAIHYVHRLSAYAVFAVIGLLAMRLLRQPAFRREAIWLLALLLLQLASGLGNVLLGWPLIAAVLHTAGAAALVVVMTGLVVATPKPALAAEPDRWQLTVPFAPRDPRSAPIAAARPAPLQPESQQPMYPEVQPQSQPQPAFTGHGPALSGLKSWSTARQPAAQAAGSSADSRIEPTGLLP